MKKQLRDDWVRALRSGEYKQIAGELWNKRNDAFCCLGVLGVCAGYERDYLGNYGSLDSTIKLRQLRDECKLGDTDSENLQGRLIELNDEQNKTFPEIADWIEANIPVTE